MIISIPYDTLKMSTLFADEDKHENFWFSLYLRNLQHGIAEFEKGVTMTTIHTDMQLLEKELDTTDVAQVTAFNAVRAWYLRALLQRVIG